MKCRNLNYDFDAWIVPEDITNYIVNNEFIPTESIPSWLEDIDNIYANDDMLYINGVAILPNSVIVWNTKLEEIQDMFVEKENFEEAYYCPFSEKGENYDI